MPDDDAIRNRLLAFIAILLLAPVLRQSYPITMPAAVAGVVIAAVWPLKTWLDQRMTSSLSYCATIATLLAILFSFVGAVYFAVGQVVGAFAQNANQFTSMYQSLTQWAQKRGVSLGAEEGYNRLLQLGQEFLSNSYTLLVYLGFIILLVMLALPEVPTFREKLDEVLEPSRRQDLGRAVDDIARKVRQYIGVTTFTSVLTGVSSAVWALVVGLDLALVWGVLNFLLNYMPVIGNLIGILPPTLYAVLQFQTWTMPVIVFIGFAVIQILISNFVYPLLQGRSLALSPLVIVIALAFWSWVWGIAGALIAVPLTVAIVSLCQTFASTRWLAHLLSSKR